MNYLLYIISFYELMNSEFVKYVIFIWRFEEILIDWLSNNDNDSRNDNWNSISNDDFDMTINSNDIEIWIDS